MLGFESRWLALPVYGAGLGAELDLVDADRRADVLQHLLAAIAEGEGQLAGDVMMDRGADADAAGRCLHLQPGGDIHAVAVAILAFEDDVAQIDADADVDPTVFGQARVAFRHAALQHDRALDGVDDAAELGQQPVAHQLEDPAAVPADFGFEEFFAMRPHALECVSLVPLHQPAIADHIGREDGC